MKMDEAIDSVSLGRRRRSLFGAFQFELVAIRVHTTFFDLHFVHANLNRGQLTEQRTANNNS